MWTGTGAGVAAAGAALPAADGDGEAAGPAVWEPQPAHINTARLAASDHGWLGRIGA
jgi:hypothetical protein